MTSQPLALPPVDDQMFRNVVGHFASGVTIITTAEGEQLFGTTVSAFSSLSLDPPMVLVCLNRSSSTHEAILRTGRFAVNVLSAEQGELAVRFARPLSNRFEGLSLETGPAGLPLLNGRLAGIECAVEAAHTGGTHTVFFGRVLSASTGISEPLAYYRGQFGAFRETRERHAFLSARRWILQREVPVGGEIEVERMAADLGLATTAVYNTLIQLSTAGLVEKHETSRLFHVAPLTAETVDDLYRNRYAIENGVIDEYLTSAPDDQITLLSEHATELASMSLDTGADLEAFLESNLEFHAGVVGLSRSKELVDQFRECSLAAAWRGTVDEQLWQQHLGHELLTGYAEALRKRDVEAAQQLLRRQNEFVRSAARTTVDTRGGSL